MNKSTRYTLLFTFSLLFSASVVSGDRFGRRCPAIPNDFDGDEISDLVLFDANTYRWYFLKSTEGFSSRTYGFGTSFPIGADIDGDGISDVDLFEANSQTWFLDQSFFGSVFSISFTSALFPLPAMGDYFLDGAIDMTVYDRANGTWYVKSSKDFTEYEFQWGWFAALPVPGDYNGDRIGDICVYYPETSTWYFYLSNGSSDLLLSNDNPTDIVQFGWKGVTPVPFDYDGDRTLDIAVYHPPTGRWFIRQSTTGQVVTFQWGWGAALPVPGDYDGDGSGDVAVYHPATGRWYIRNANGTVRLENFGYAAALPVTLFQ